MRPLVLLLFSNLMLATVLLVSCHWNTDYELFFRRVLVNESPYTLEGVVVSGGWRQDSVTFLLNIGDTLVYEGGEIGDHVLSLRSGLGWVEADSMFVTANDSLRLRYVRLALCNERNPLEFDPYGCNGYDQSKDGGVYVGTFTFTASDFLEAESVFD
jgi:hypothetical protein